MLSTSRSLSKDLSKDSLYRKIAQKQQTPRTYELETTDRTVFGLFDPKEIDSYFNELCKESKTKLSTVQAVANYIKATTQDRILSPRSGTSRNSNAKSPTMIRADDHKPALKGNVIRILFERLNR